MCLKAPKPLEFVYSEAGLVQKTAAVPVEEWVW